MHKIYVVEHLVHKKIIVQKIFLIQCGDGNICCNKDTQQCNEDNDGCDPKEDTPQTIRWCLDTSACNYDPNANTDSTRCILLWHKHTNMQYKHTNMRKIQSQQYPVLTYQYQ